MTCRPATPATDFPETAPRRRIAPAVLAVALLSLAACGTAQPPAPVTVARDDIDSVKRQVQALIEHEMRERKLSGLSIALVDDQRVVWSQGFGWADAKEKRPATPQTLYRVGSISKLFTAAAAMQLAEQGRLKLDAPVREALPEFDPRSRFEDSRRITPRQLLTHHSGLPRDIVRGMWTASPARFTQVTADLSREEAVLPPDTAFSYSNLGFDVLGHAVERLSGRPFEDHLRQAVLAPLGMNDSSFSVGVPTGPLMARAHRNGEPARESALRDLPAGGLNSSVLDLGRFLAMVFAQGRGPGGAAVLQPSTVEQMLAVQNDGIPFDVGFRNGLGWMLSTLGPHSIQGAGPVAHHSGATENFRSQLYALPRHKLGVVVLSNDGAGQRAVDRVAVRALGLLLQARTGTAQPQPAKPAQATQPWTEAALKAYEGDYTTELGHVRIQLRGGGLKGEAFGRTFSLQPLQDGGLGLRYSVLGLFPVSLDELDFVSLSLRRVAGRELLVARSAGQDWLLGEKLQPLHALRDPQRLAGRYVVLNRLEDDPLRIEAQVEAVRGFYLVRLKDAGGWLPESSLPLLPVAEDALVLSGSLNGWGGVVRPHLVDGQPQIEFSGYVMRRVAD